MFDDGLDDDSPVYRQPPPADDRIWRHPSEVAAGMARRRRVSMRSPWFVALLSGLIGASLSAGVVTVLARPDHVVERVTVEREAERPAALANATGQPVADIAQRVRPAIAQLLIQGGKGGQASASGVIFRDDGHLLTNFHVIDGASSIKVVLANGQQLAGRVVGGDADSDVAVVKIPGGPFPVVTLGSAADLKVGQEAIAIGSPLGAAGGPSVTVGVVSALHRTVDVNGHPALLDMIQTDAPISPGSTGGALLDASGAVIGVTTSVAVSDVGAEGLGYATPIDAARSSAEQLIAVGHVVHVWLGVEGTDLDTDTANDLHLEGGALVGQVVNGSPASRAGMLTSDIIVAVDGTSVSGMEALLMVLRNKHPGDIVTLDVLRHGARTRLRVILGTRPAS